MSFKLFVISTFKFLSDYSKRILDDKKQVLHVLSYVVIGCLSNLSSWSSASWTHVLSIKFICIAEMFSPPKVVGQKTVLTETFSWPPSKTWPLTSSYTASKCLSSCRRVHIFVGAKVYRAALTRFVDDIRAVEENFGMKILCSNPLEDLAKNFWWIPFFKIDFSRFQEYAGEHQAPSVVLQFQVSLYRPQMIVLPRRALPYLYVLEFGVQTYWYPFTSKHTRIEVRA